MVAKDLHYTYEHSEYDRDYNLLYIKVNPTIQTGRNKTKTEVDYRTTSNLAIYDIGKDKLIHFFEKGSTNKIVYHIYETSYNETMEKMEFNKGNFKIFNNQKIEKRAKADKLFIVTEKPDNKEYELWVSSRLGNDKKMVKVFPKELDWRIDVYNMKIIFIYRLENEIKVEAIDW